MDERFIASSIKVPTGEEQREEIYASKDGNEDWRDCSRGELLVISSLIDKKDGRNKMQIWLQLREDQDKNNKGGNQKKAVFKASQVLKKKTSSGAIVQRSQEIKWPICKIQRKFQLKKIPEKSTKLEDQSYQSTQGGREETEPRVLPPPPR